MKNKFKVGDIVTGKRGNLYYYTNENMIEGVITHISGSGLLTIKPLKFNETANVSFCEFEYLEPEQFKLVKPKKINDKHDWKLVIIPDGNETKAMYYKDGNFVKKVTCRKHPDDEYSEKVACETLINRLFGEEEKKPTKSKFKVGDLVEVTCGELKGLRGYVATINDIILVDFKIEYPWGHRGLGLVLPNNTGKYFAPWELKKV